jgi:SagB-type dehydrogenase family enzyme
MQDRRLVLRIPRQLAGVSKGTSVRRSPFLVSFWEGGTHWVYNYLRRTRRGCSPVELAVLDAASSWETADFLRDQVRAQDAAEFDGLIDCMIESGLLERLDQPPNASSVAMEAWDSWNPAAGFFHAVTKSPDLDPDTDEEPPFLRLRAFPSPLKHYSGRPRTDLPLYKLPGNFEAVLNARRTWREFGERDLTLRETAALLGATFGVQRWLEVENKRLVALKTSPSGGARHGVEAYLLAFNVEGLEPGVYHYGPDAHSLTRLDGSLTHEDLARYLPRQKGFHDPAALVVMTSVFARLQWKYPHPHAYRVALLDAGHLGQTFALVATALGLAPFCTAAIDSGAFEQLLGIDGISESALFVVGVGARPESKDWAPMHDRSARSPTTSPPAWAARLDGSRDP